MGDVQVDTVCKESSDKDGSPVSNVDRSVSDSSDQADQCRESKPSDMSIDSGDECDLAHQNLQTNLVRKHRRRRGKSKKRKWKPYYKLTLEERKNLEENEARRADRVRAERFAHGQPVAPYNTTQFLMEDHDIKEPDLDRVHMHNTLRHRHIRRPERVSSKHNSRRSSPLVRENDEECPYYSSPDDEGDFLQREFSEDYKNAHAERLNSMSKGELVQEYLQLEDRVEKLERELMELRSRMNETSSRCPSRGNAFFLPIDIQSSSRCSSVGSESTSRELRTAEDAVS